jgi:GH15 family glucan-1,4-alpha-glucosidase
MAAREHARGVAGIVTASSIADYAPLSDRHSGALVSKRGSIDWLSFPRSDSPSVFAAVLDDDAGHWPIRPAGAFTGSRRYIGAAMVLQTRFDTPAGAMVLTDALATSIRMDPHQARCPRAALAHPLAQVRPGVFTHSSGSPGWTPRP